MMTVNKLSERESDSLSTSQQSALLLGTMKFLSEGDKIKTVRSMLLLRNATSCLSDTGHNHNPNQ